MINREKSQYVVPFKCIINHNIISGSIKHITSNTDDQGSNTTHSVNKFTLNNGKDRMSKSRKVRMILRKIDEINNKNKTQNFDRTKDTKYAKSSVAFSKSKPRPIVSTKLSPNDCNLTSNRSLTFEQKSECKRSYLHAFKNINVTVHDTSLHQTEEQQSNIVQTEGAKLEGDGLVNYEEFEGDVISPNFLSDKPKPYGQYYDKEANIDRLIYDELMTHSVIIDSDDYASFGGRYESNDGMTYYNPYEYDKASFLKAVRYYVTTQRKPDLQTIYEITKKD